MNKVESFYDSSPETEWARQERHRTEFAVTQRALAEFLPPPPARVLDIGGGPGRYAIHLATQGYAVTLLDLSSANLKLARAKAREHNVRLDDYIHANALDLPARVTGPFDAALLLGPLYHLTRLEDRRAAVQAALDVLRPGGVLFAAWICVFAPLRDAAIKYPEREALLLREARFLEDGAYDGDGGFTEAYFAHPAEIEAFMAGFDLRPLAFLACEGIAAGHEEALNNLQGAAWDYWADLNYRLSKEPSLRGAADHLLYIGCKP